MNGGRSKLRFEAGVVDEQVIKLSQPFL